MKNEVRSKQQVSITNRRGILVGGGIVLALAFAIGIFTTGGGNDDFREEDYLGDVQDIKKVTSVAKWGAVDFEFNEIGGELTWNLETMRFADEFVVESSLDNVNFQQIGLQKAGKAFDYSFTDKDVAFIGMPRVYYRLKMKGLDYQEFYSPVKVVEMPIKLGLYGFVSANRQKIQCFYAADEPEEIDLLIKNELGETVHQTKVRAENNTKVESLQPDALGAGNYTLYLINAETEYRADFKLED